MSTSDDYRAQAVDRVQQAGAVIAELGSGLDLTPEPLYVSWSDCSSATAPDPKHPTEVVWEATLYYVPAREQHTTALLDPVVAAMVDKGWATDDVSTGDLSRSIRLHKDDYVLDLDGTTAEAKNAVVATVVSPCFEVPDDFVEHAGRQ